MVNRSHNCLLFVLVAVSLLSCGIRKEYVQESKGDTIFLSKTDVRYDSVYVDRYRNVYVSGDTVHDEVYLTEYKLVYRDRTDTVYERSVDVREVKSVERVNERSGYDRFVSWGFWVLVVVLLLWVAWRVVKAVYLRK